MSYADETYASTYFSGTVNEDAWNEINSDLKPKLLLSASNYIDVAFKYSGQQTDEVKAFPRTQCVNYCTSYTYLDSEIPVIVQNATCEIALEMSKDEELNAGGLNSFDENIIKEKVDTLEVQYKDNSSSVKSPDAFGYTWLQCILARVSGVSSYRVRKG